MDTGASQGFNEASLAHQHLSCQLSRVTLHDEQSHSVRSDPFDVE